MISTYVFHVHKYCRTSIKSSYNVCKTVTLKENINQWAGTRGTWKIQQRRTELDSGSKGRSLLARFLPLIKYTFIVFNNFNMELYKSPSFPIIPTFPKFSKNFYDSERNFVVCLGTFSISSIEIFFLIKTSLSLDIHTWVSYTSTYCTIILTVCLRYMNK